MSKETSPVQYQADSGYFMATLLRKGTEKNENDTINSKNDTTNDTITAENDTINELSDKERQIFDSIKQENNITAHKIATQLNISIITVKRAINTLKIKGLIVRVGSNKTGFWSVKEN